MKARYIIVGVLCMLVVLPVFAWVIARAKPRRDFTALLDAPMHLMAHPGPTVVRGRALLGSDVLRVRATLDGAAVPMQWSGAQFSVPLARVSAGAHLLELSTAYRAGIRRGIAVPIIAGPFLERREWIPSAIEISLAPSSVDSESHKGDLASALREYIRHTATEPTEIGTLIDVPMSLAPGPDEHTVTVRGHAVYQHGGVFFSVDCRFAQSTATSLTLEPSHIHALPDERTRAYVHSGAVAKFIAAISRAFTGRDWVATRTLAHTQQRTEALFGSVIPRMARVLRLPESVALGPNFHDALLQLRFAGPPLFPHNGGMIVRLDARIERRAGYRPLRLGSLRPHAMQQSSHLRVAPGLVAALFAAYASEGRLNAELNAAIRPDKSEATQTPVRLERIHLETAPLLQREPGGALGWRLPDVKLEFRSARPNPHDFRAYVGGTIRASLARRHAEASVAIQVDTLAIDCRKRVPEGWRFDTCLADVLGSVDLRRALNDRLRGMRWFATRLDRIGDLRLPGFVPLHVMPTHLAIDPASGEPIVDLTADVWFGGRSDLTPN